ncbi:MAG: FAD:protein FMN transferase [Limnochordales bacterium]|nr:FAD:protein FMN transferase [Limnochordales bacterium]
MSFTTICTRLRSIANLKSMRPLLLAALLPLTAAAGGCKDASPRTASVADPQPGAVFATVGEAGDAAAEAIAFTMGTYVQIKAEAASQEQAERALQAALRELDRLSAIVDRFRPDSQVSLINSHAGDQSWVEVSPDIISMLQTARQVAEKSGGAFDPTIAPLVDLWGFVEAAGESGPESDGGQEAASHEGVGKVGPTHIRGHKPPAAASIAQLLPLVSYKDVEIDEAGGRVRLHRPGQALDLGGIAKGYGVHQVARILRQHGVIRALVDLGGNIYALGTKADGSPWRVGIQDPRDPGGIIAVVPVTDAALSTSGDYERYFEYDGVRYSHLLDPHTGWPARDVLSVTVITPDGALGDALSTAAFVLGRDRGLALLESLPDVEGIVVLPDFSVRITSGLAGKVEVVGRGRLDSGTTPAGGEEE